MGLDIIHGIVLDIKEATRLYFRPITYTGEKLSSLLFSAKSYALSVYKRHS